MMPNHSVSHCISMLATVIVCVFLMLPSAELIPNFPHTHIMMTPNVTLDGCHHCDQRYFKHYKTKQCIPVYDDGCKCPKGFDCPKLPAVKDTTVCTYGGKTYSKGEPIPTSNVCQECICGTNYNEGLPTSSVYMSCVRGECFNGIPEEGCYYVYEQGDCCPRTKKCSKVEHTCEFEGKKYYLGQHIYSEEDDCLICLCDKDFHGKNSKSCRIYDCDLEQDLPDLKRGCLPIYHEKTCCPIEFRCPNGSEVRKPGPNAYTAFDELDPLSHCVFNGRRFAIGDELDIAHPTNCVTCTCITPPDFTCIHKDCEFPPVDKNKNCQTIFIPGQCCPKHSCTPL